jgi:ATP-dependent Zn protease
VPYTYVPRPSTSESRLYAEGTQLLMDAEVGRILTEAGERGGLLAERQDSLYAVIDLLLEQETIDGEELMVRRPVETVTSTQPVA